MTASAINWSISALETIGGLNVTDIANVTNVSEATVSQWRDGTKFPHPNNERILSDLYNVVRRLEDYYTNDDIRRWLYAGHPQLEEQRAIDFIGGGEAIEVFRILDRLDSCGYL